MKPESVQHCVWLNNQGVDHLSNMRFGAAVTAFTRALRLAKRVLLSEHPQSKSQTRKNVSSLGGDEGEARRECTFFSVQGPAHEEVLDSSHHHQTSVDSHNFSCDDQIFPFVYSTPLRISESVAIEDYESSVKLSVAIMFNLALSHHLNGVKNCHARDPDTLSHAVALYELAYQLQMQEDIEVSVETTMAIINNLGHVHRMLDDQEKASQCFNHLLSTMLFVQSLGDADVTCKTEGFFHNVTHLILKKSGAPAA